MKLRYAPVELTKTGHAADEAAVDAALDLAESAYGGAATDVLLLSHGWNNGIREAEDLFEELTDNLADVAKRRTGTAPKYVVVGLLWPSMRWWDPDDLAGGLAAVDDVAALVSAVDQRVEDPATAALLRRLAGSVDTSAVARDQFVELVLTLLPRDPAAVADDDAVPVGLLDGAPAELLEAVAEAEADLLDGGDTGPAGLGFADLAPSLLARRLLNLATYYTMKDRAGKVGANGVAPLVDALNRQPGGRRVHLAGHSFGARVVAAAAKEADTPVSSVTLLQAAFSHTAFSGRSVPPGAFRAVLDGKVSGPLVVTHTHNDRAVRLAYALASRLARQVSARVGDRDDPYGGLGANGAVRTDGALALTMGDADATYSFTAGKVHNLRSDAHVSSHGDVRNPAVANAWLSAITAGIGG